jgi:hypothetical protein
MEQRSLIDRVLLKAAQLRKENKNLRFGQSLFQGLAEVNPELASRIAGQGVDPYHDNNKVTLFCEWVEKNDK